MDIFLFGEVAARIAFCNKDMGRFYRTPFRLGAIRQSIVKRVLWLGHQGPYGRAGVRTVSVVWSHLTLLSGFKTYLANEFQLRTFANGKGLNDQIRLRPRGPQSLPILPLLLSGEFHATLFSSPFLVRQTTAL